MADEKKLPPLNFDTSLDLIQAVDGCQHVSDMGISALAFITRYGTCSLHGQLTDEVDVSGGAALAGDYICCPNCKAMGVTRRCPVEAIGPVEEK